MWQKIKYAFARFMQGRYGGDQLSRTTVIAGLILYIVAMLTRFSLISYLAMALYIWAIYRMFSRNVEKRYAENQKYLNLTRNFKVRFSQAKNRAKNSKQYKYFRCDRCKAYLKLPRGVGEVTVTCGKCGNQFRKKA